MLALAELRDKCYRSIDLNGNVISRQISERNDRIARVLAEIIPKIIRHSTSSQLVDLGIVVSFKVLAHSLGGAVFEYACFNFLIAVCRFMRMRVGPLDVPKAALVEQEGFIKVVVGLGTGVVVLQHLLPMKYNRLGVDFP